MTVHDFLQLGTARLAAAGIESARLDCLVLLEDELGIDRALILAHGDHTLAPTQQTALRTKCDQRVNHTPLAYIRGKAPFYGRVFLVTPDVLVPRPETETMVSLVKELPALDPGTRIVDVGTGSGCIGISVALELPSSKVSLFDIDPHVLRVARKNAQLLGAQVQTGIHNVLEGIGQDFDLVLANLPYVPEHYPINQAATHEPQLALFAGPDGLDAYRTLWRQLTGLSARPAHIFTEALEEQHEVLAALANQAGYSQRNQKGLIQHFAG
ncbi:MAG TPA: HemK/PrmC family methyltransferase [Candidatus Saccharimonadales bacterium]|nr:HemK/PrmC family methyltransferase [Candidatus Saccharimonadales bacterium]